MRFVVAAVEDRKPNVEYMKRHLPNLEVFYDYERKSAFWNWLRIWEEIHDTGAVSFEDDVCLTKNFVEKVTAVIESRPEDVIQFFSRRAKDLSIGSRWDRDFNYLCCTYFPPALTGRFVDYEKKNDYRRTSKGNAQDGSQDIMVSEALRWYGKKYWLHVPSLVQHLEIRSAIDPRRSTKRQSKTFVDPELDGLPPGSLTLQQELFDV